MSEDKNKKQDTVEEISEGFGAETVSKKKVVYAEIDDEISSLFDKIRPISAKHVYIVVPKRSILFQSVVNLKILKRKAEDIGKKIYLITNDSNGVYLAQQIGITVYDKVNGEGKPSLFNAENGDDKLRITPLRATVNSIEDQAPTRLSERKISISEILQKSKKKMLDIRKIGKDKAQKRKEEKKEKKGARFVMVAPNRHALIGLISVSLIILLVVVYIALPGVTIYLTPSASVLEKSVNITLADFSKNKAELDLHPSHTIASYPISSTVVKTITHYPTGKKISERGSNSSGKIIIYNTSENQWPLIPQTRFQTDDGLVFRINTTVNVPPAGADGPGQAEAFVTADPVDAYGEMIGERGNIATSRFFLPGLKESSRSKLYAENPEPMSGGVTDFISYVSAEDIEAARARINEELLKVAAEELEISVQGKTDSMSGDTTYSLLQGDGAIKIGDVEIEESPGLEGREVSEFTITGKVYVSGLYYDHDVMLEILKNELLLKKSPQKELLRINEESTTYRIFEWDEATGKVKLTANIKGIEQFEINPEKENGERLLTKIREHIVGADIGQAEAYIQNLPEINKVEIDSWPAWSPTIPSLPENIDFEVREAITVE